MNIGLLCYASIGGSGIVATELGKALADRGHQVHFISTDLPFRLTEFHPGLAFHQVQTPSYPLFREPQYMLSLANRLVQVAREFRLAIVHAHYAIPHATVALLGRQVLSSAGTGPAPKVVTTLHGTDITLVGSDPSYSEIVAYSIEQSDGVTAVSQSLADATRRQLGVRGEIDVIPNFIDCTLYRRRPDPLLRRRFAESDDTKLVIHVSNFRPVKRIDSVMQIFARISERVSSRLLLVGDGPELSTAYRLGRELGVADRTHIPSAQESFGLAALEAMACEVPVVASNVGGLPEVIEHGVSGFLHPPEEVEAMAESGIKLLSDAAVHASVTRAAVARVRREFCEEKIVPLYERAYERVIAEGEFGRRRSSTGRREEGRISNKVSISSDDRLATRSSSWACREDSQTEERSQRWRNGEESPGRHAVLAPCNARSLQRPPAAGARAPGMRVAIRIPPCRLR